MKRRSFLKFLSGIIPAAIVAKKVIEHEPTKEEVMAEWQEKTSTLKRTDPGLGYGTSTTIDFYANKTGSVSHHSPRIRAGDMVAIDENGTISKATSEVDRPLGIVVEHNGQKVLKTRGGL